MKQLSETTFFERKEAANVLRGAISAIEAVFRTGAPLTVKRKLFNAACWLVSERNGKFNTKYCTESALLAPRKSLIHEHVVPRAGLWIVVRRTMAVESALHLSEGCIVTTEEHSKLHEFEEAYAWERYVKSGINVVDRSTGKRVPKVHLNKMSLEYKMAYRAARFVDDGEEELFVTVGR